ncbi:hypothetical protein ScPMuIL_017971 [Solemya velum]
MEQDFRSSRPETVKREGVRGRMTAADLFDSSEDVFSRAGDVSPPEDPQTREVTEELASFVANGGPSLEERAFTDNKDNPAFWFLYEPNSQAYKYYQFKLQKLKNSKKTEQGNDADTDDIAETSTQRKARKKRRSRWGPQGEVTDIPTVIPPVVIPPPPTAAPPSHTVTLQDFAQRMVGSDTLNDEQIKQIRDQQELNMMYNLILAQKKAKEAALMAEVPGTKVKPKYEYDSDEDTEGGTWEHKQRSGEMQATKEWADQLTETNKGKHFIGDFLPPDELERFMETYRALQEGREPDLSDYKDFKLTCENLGYQMLQKLGWKEGEGLGTEGQGITAPVNKGQRSLEGSGFGMERPADLSKGDDEYDAFRKRMMLAYRFRPNPLNNPRRPYY